MKKNIIKILPYLISLIIIYPILNNIGLQELFGKLFIFIINNNININESIITFITIIIYIIKGLLIFIIGYFLKKLITNINNQTTNYNSKKTIILSILYLIIFIILTFTNKIGSDWGGIIIYMYLLIFIGITIFTLFLNYLGKYFKIKNKIFFYGLLIGNILQILNIIFIILLILNGTYI